MSTSETRAAEPATRPGPRHDVYGLIHKGLRGFMFDTLGRLSAADVGTPLEVLSALRQVSALLTTLHEHIEHENRFLHPAIEARRPGGSAATARDHDDHATARAELTQLLDAAGQACESVQGAELASLVNKLYLNLSFFVADNLTHMYREETETTAVLWQLYSDDELLGVEAAIVASQTPEQLATGMRWMIPSLTPVERARLLGRASRGLPPPAFQRLLGLAKSVLTESQYAQLARSLG